MYSWATGSLETPNSQGPEEVRAWPGPEKASPWGLGPGTCDSRSLGGWCQPHPGLRGAQVPPPDTGPAEERPLSRGSSLPTPQQSWAGRRGAREVVAAASAGPRGHFVKGDAKQPGNMPEVTSRAQGTKKESGRNW